MSVANNDLRLLMLVRHEKGCKKCDVRDLIQKGANPVVQDPANGLQPIHYSARWGDIPVIEALLEDKRVYADAVDRRGKVPYEWADDFQHPKAEVLLLKAIICNPKRYSLESIREAQVHIALKKELGHPIPDFHPA